MAFFFGGGGGGTEHFSGRIGALRWIILVGKQKHNVQKPIVFIIPTSDFSDVTGTI